MAKERVAVIGVAGENLVKFAGVVSGGHSHARMAARGGMGAVLGSKNLKAIVVRGKDKPQYADAKGFHANHRNRKQDEISRRIENSARVVEQLKRFLRADTSQTQQAQHQRHRADEQDRIDRSFVLRMQTCKPRG